MTAERLLILMGPTCSGKTSVAQECRGQGWQVLSAREVIEALSGDSAGCTREKLLERGLQLERETRGSWILDSVVQGLARAEFGLIVDSVRTVAQLAAARTAGPEGLMVRSVFLDAAAQVRELRYGLRIREGRGGEIRFWELEGHEIERQIGGLQAVADVHVRTDQRSVAEIAMLVESLFEAG